MANLYHSSTSHFCVLGRSVSNVILTMPLAGSFVFRWLDLPRSTYVAYQIWNSTFIRLRDKRWSKIYKVSHVTLRTPLQGAIYHSFASTRHDPPTYQIWSMVTNLKSGSCHPVTLSLLLAITRQDPMYQTGSVCLHPFRWWEGWPNLKKWVTSRYPATATLHGQLSLLPSARREMSSSSSIVGSGVKA